MLPRRAATVKFAASFMAIVEVKSTAWLPLSHPW